MVFLKNRKGSISLDKSCSWDDEAPKEIVVKNLRGKGLSNIRMNSDSSSISCGVAQVYGMPTNTHMEMVVNIIKAAAKTELEEKELMALLFKKVFKPVVARYIMLSDNKAGSRSIIQGVLSDICETETGWAKNPNSGNNIKVWTYKKTR